MVVVVEYREVGEPKPLNAAEFDQDERDLRLEIEVTGGAASQLGLSNIESTALYPARCCIVTPISSGELETLSATIPP